MLIIAAKVEGSVTLSVNGTAFAEDLVADEQVAEGWRGAIADIAGTSATHVQLDPPPFIERAVRLSEAVDLSEAVNLSEAGNVSDAANLSSPLTGNIRVPYVIIVPADSEDHAANLSSLLAASIMSTSPSELAESIARHVSEATGGAEYHFVVEEIAEPTAGVELLQVVVAPTSTTDVTLASRYSAASSAPRALHLGQASLLAAGIVSVVW